MAHGGPRPPVLAAPDVPVDEPVNPVVPWPPAVLPFEPELLAVPPFDPPVIVDEPLGDEPPDPEVPLLSEPLDRQQPPSSTIANALILMATATDMDHGRMEIAIDQRQAARLLGDWGRW
jgi:hypothetical protein